MNNLPDQIDEMHFWVLDHSNAKDIDFQCVPMFSIHSYMAPPALLKIGPYTVMVPLDWAIIIGDKNLGHLEPIEIHKLNDRDFDAFVFNPSSSYAPSFMPITLLDIYPDIEWNIPSLSNNHFLCMPVGEEAQWPTKQDLNKTRYSDCIYIIKAQNKMPDDIDISQLV